MCKPTASASKNCGSQTEHHQPGSITYTTGWPMDSKTYGGSFPVSPGKQPVVVGFVIGLDYENPHLSPTTNSSASKPTRPSARCSEGGRRISYGARALSEGGIQNLPS